VSGVDTLGRREIECMLVIGSSRARWSGNPARRLARGRGLHQPPEYDGHDGACRLPNAGAAAAVDDFDVGSMFVDDLFHHGQSEARAARLGSHIRLECTPKYIRRETGSVVLDG
jgi:hypothetical protein